MWGESSKVCESNCQCSGLITENFRINSGNNGKKRKQEDALASNYSKKMNPHTIDFTKSPISPVYTQTKRRILGEIQLPKSPLDRLKSPLTNSPKPYKSPAQPINSPLLTSPFLNQSSPMNRGSPLSTRVKRSRITKVVEERNRFKMSNKENIGSLVSETFEEEARDFLFGERFDATRKVTNWSGTELNFTHALQKSPKEELFVPEKELTQDVDEDLETLHDLEQEFEADNFDECTKYEIISTDSPDIISRGRTATSRKVTSRNFVFGAPLAEDEASTSFNKPTVTATRMLNFDDDDDFEFPSPAVKKQAAKKSLKFTETPTKFTHEKSDSSIGSMSQSPLPKPGLYTTESTTSIESGFISELDEPFLAIEDSSSPKVANFSDLLSGQIKSNVVTEQQSFLRRPMSRSLSFNPESKASRARVSLFSILENPGQRNKKRVERSENEVANKRRRSNIESPVVKSLQRPVLQRAYSENNALIMSAMARSMVEPDLIGDFSVPYALPLIDGDHSDLKSISCETLAGLLRGEYKDVISDFMIIDCRYPYEFEGGHILSALNYYTTEHIHALVRQAAAGGSTVAARGRRVLVFHCEFSLERGPKLCRYLRSTDRNLNKDQYPALNYPECYLLRGGYRAFHTSESELCAPQGYTRMRDPEHVELYRKHRDQS